MQTPAARIRSAKPYRGVLIVQKLQRKRLAGAGWAIGSAKDYLGFSDAEAALIELKRALSQSLSELCTGWPKA